ncbi:enoyl-CoA hydratase/isomerase family protein [Hylemonella gracilis]|uniref:Enoyl-CoA hydratase/isomerase family protein n=2 Tax=Hylemonella gracilis TaxID=80880 RepID=A0A4P6UP27_9BURK|nr:enoyl-CoA hydratase/isomerase family protein [Hylemonella gracilis]
MTTFRHPSCPELLLEQRGHLGCITLNRPRALNALSLPMVRALTQALRIWRDDPAIQAVAIRGQGKDGPFGAFCAGGDIRYFHEAVLRGDAEVEDFFTEEYTLNHLIHHYPKPYIAFMDGVVMGGGMGIAQGASLRIVTERTKMAMPETQIGLFPDVGGGWFLARCPRRGGAWLALTSEVIGAGEALALDLADACFGAPQLQQAWDDLADLSSFDADTLETWRRRHCNPSPASTLPLDVIERCFDSTSVLAIVQTMEAMLAQKSDHAEWTENTVKALRTHSPLMLEVTLQLMRKGANMDLAEELRLERDLVRHCFNTRHLDRYRAATETMEGIRALVIDKDRQPKWNPARLEEVTPEMVAGFFVSPWPTHAHPLKDLV